MLMVLCGASDRIATFKTKARYKKINKTNKLDKEIKLNEHA